MVLAEVATDTSNRAHLLNSLTFIGGPFFGADVRACSSVRGALYPVTHLLGDSAMALWLLEQSPSHEKENLRHQTPLVGVYIYGCCLYENNNYSM